MVIIAYLLYEPTYHVQHHIKQEPIRKDRLKSVLVRVNVSLGPGPPPMRNFDVLRLVNALNAGKFWPVLSFFK